MSVERRLADQVQAHLLDQPDADPTAVLGRLAPLLPQDERVEVLRLVRSRRVGLGPVDELLGDPRVSEVMVNGPGTVWIEREGRLEASALSLDRGEIDLLVERLMIPIGRRVDQRSPCIDGRLADGSRVNVVVPPIALDGPYITIRRFVVQDVELQDFGTEAAAVLAAEVLARRNVIVSGGTGAGKTTLLNAIAREVDASERIVTAEDAAELRLPHPHVVRLETRPESAEHVGLITMRDLVRNALRMRPDRLILGEISRAGGKDTQGRISVQASQRGNHVLIQVRDDGRGIDVDAVRATAVSRGLIERDTTLSEKETLELVFHPGFSTRAFCSRIRQSRIAHAPRRPRVAFRPNRVFFHSSLGSALTATTFPRRDAGEAPTLARARGGRV